MNVGPITTREHMIDKPSGSLPGGFYKTLMDSMFDAVFTVDSDCTITYWNDSCTRITGYSAEEMIGQNYHETGFSCLEDGNAQSCPQRDRIKIVLGTGMPGTWKGYVRRRTGQPIPVESHISPIRDMNENVVGAVEVFRDFSSQIALEQAHRQVIEMSRNDQLTGLLNRRAITELLKAEIERRHRYQQEFSLVMIDIDHFKAVNDDFGHDVGDKVLKALGGILLNELRKPDAAGRWGGEEFVVLAPGSDAQAAAQLAERLRGIVRKTELPEVPRQITASFGVAHHQDDESWEQRLNRADQALYQAKDAGRDRVAISPATAQQSAQPTNP